jgi:hypothetical protein
MTSRRTMQEARRAERARVVDDGTLWHMTFVAVVSYFDLRDGHIDDRAWTDKAFAALDLPALRTGITDSMRARKVWNDTFAYLQSRL